MTSGRLDFVKWAANAARLDFRCPDSACVLSIPRPSIHVQSVSPGLLLVRGPNVMQGYLGQPEKTAEVLRDGWYVTGDIAVLDEDGFLSIIDRLSRFSKIGGEMVPHMKIEEQIHAAAGVTEHSFAVTGVPDEKKGERLIVLHILDEAQLQACLERFAEERFAQLVETACGSVLPRLRTTVSWHRQARPARGP